MAHISADRVKETTTVTGTGAATLLGAASGYRAFSSVCANGDTCWYGIADQGGLGWEVGLGTWGTGGVLTRTAVIASSNSNNPVSFAAGTKDVFITLPADKVLDVGADGGVNVPVGSTDPNPDASLLKLYAKWIAGRAMLKFVGPSGVDSAFQPALFQNRIIMWTPGTAALPTYMGQAPSLTATCSHPTPTTGSIGTLCNRAQFATSTTAGNPSGLRSIAPSVLIGNATNRGGFFKNWRFNGGSLHTTGRQVAIGLTSGTTVLGGEPSSTLNDFLGICLDSTDANWQFARRTGTGAATKIDLGLAAAANQFLEMTMFIKPSGTDLGVRIQQINNDGSATILLDTTYNTVLPAVTTLLGPRFEVRNGALAAAHNIGLNRMYLESDF